MSYVLDSQDLFKYNASHIGLAASESTIRLSRKFLFAKTRKDCGDNVGYFSGIIIREDIQMRTSVDLPQSLD